MKKIISKLGVLMFVSNSILFCATANAHQYTIDNKTDADLKVCIIYYKGDNIKTDERKECANNEKTIPKDTPLTINSGLLCAKYLTIRAIIGGSLIRTRWYPKQTSSGISCRSDDVQVKDSGSGKLSLE